MTSLGSRPSDSHDCYRVRDRGRRDNYEATYRVYTDTMSYDDWYNPETERLYYDANSQWYQPDEYVDAYATNLQS